jgi:hypothetical protein
MTTENTTTSGSGEGYFPAAASPVAPPKRVMVVCDGGLVRDVLNLLPGQDYELFDADGLENGGDDAADYWDELSEEVRALALDRYKDWATEAQQLSEARKTGPDHLARRARMEALLNGTAAVTNGYESPEKPLRYVGVEWSGDEIVWAYTADKLEQLKTIIDTSETERDHVRMVDLDTGDQYQAVLKVSDFTKINP